MRTIRISQKIPASLDALWVACATPSGIAGWQADRVTGAVQTGETLGLGWPDLGVSIRLDVLELAERRLIVFGHGDSRVRFEVKEGEVELQHSAPFEDDEELGTESSWRLALGTLAHYVDRYAGQERETVWLVKPAKTTAEAAHAFFTLPDALAAWLGRATTAIGSVGSRYRIALSGGGSMSGVVLAHTEGRDLALRWDEASYSVITFRTLPSPTGAQERLLVISWSRWSELENAERIAGELDGALARLVQLLGTAGAA
ncbi:MAG TPA: hypothetical protein VHB79_17305 [Polyangiaceae bacterium]|nr:hypothetical protein [Polyangiaceae bacterium]